MMIAIGGDVNSGDDLPVGLSPRPVAAELVKQMEWLQCGGCGWNGPVTHYIFVDKPWCFDPVCNCPVPATLTA